MKIILAVDRSEFSRWAVDLVLGLPLTTEPEIIVLHVVDLLPVVHPAMTPILARQYGKSIRQELNKNLKAAKRLTETISKRLGKKWQSVRPVVDEGHVAERIISWAKREKADLIILGSRGLHNIKAFLMGSVSQKVVTHSPCSVIVVKKKTPRFKKILLGVDGSAFSIAAVAFVKAHFRPKDIQATVLNVWDSPFILKDLLKATLEEKETRELRAAGFKAKGLTVTGHPAANIVKAIRREKTNLAVVGSRGLMGAKQFLLGSVSSKVVKYSPCPVLVVRVP
jgi:nucleotide-binding universal stress UspA family protein